MRVADVCSGLGNFSFGLEATGFFETTSFCEVDAHCREWLDQEWPGIPVFRDLRELHAQDIGPIDVLVGGVPCQPASLAGRRAGSEDKRWLWPDFLRLASEALPRWIVAENPLGILTIKPHGLEWIHESLEQAGYEVCPIAVGADECGAPHRRDRAWIIARLANADRAGLGERGRPGLDRARESGLLALSGGPSLADPNSVRQSQSGGGESELRRRLVDGGQRNVADSDSGGIRDLQQREPWPGHEIDSTRESESTGRRLGDADRPGLADVQGRSQNAQVRRRGPAGRPNLPARWPARRGEPQHDWEPARVFHIKNPPIGLVGGLPDGSTSRLGLRLNRAVLKALGNGIVPQIPFEIGLAIAACEGLI